MLISETSSVRILDPRPRISENMDAFEEELKLLLNGKAISSGPIDCSFDDGRDQFIPLTKRTVRYIVAAVILNEENEVLMIQEAARSCRHLWYLPAGRMEPGESIVDAVIREVKEEAGVDFVPETLIAVETQGAAWWRFTMTGMITGGHLKTIEEGDDESLQAKWFKLEDIKCKSGNPEFKLRARDIIPLIEMTKQFKLIPPELRYSNILPVENPHKEMILRSLIVQYDEERSQSHIVVGKDKSPHLPMSRLSHRHHVGNGQRLLLQSIFGNADIHCQILGVVTVEFYGKPEHLNDGICLTVMIKMIPTDNALLKINNEKYDWHLINDEEHQKGISVMLRKDMLVPFLLL